MSREFESGPDGGSSAPESGAGPPRGGHPTPEELLAFHFGALEATDHGRVEDHLSRCPECAQVVLDFAAFPELEPAEEMTPELERRLEGHRRGLIRQLREGGLELGTEAEGRSAPRVEEERAEAEDAGGRVVPGPWRRRLRTAWAVAAVFFVTTVGLSLWIARNHLETPEPRIGPLEAHWVATRRSGTEPTPILPTDAPKTLVLMLRPTDMDFADYRIELLGPGGQELWSRRGFEPDESGALELQIWGGWQPPGRYRFEIYGLHGNEAVQVGSLPVEFIDDTRGETQIR